MRHRRDHLLQLNPVALHDLAYFIGSSSIISGEGFFPECPSVRSTISNGVFLSLWSDALEERRECFYGCTPFGNLSLPGPLDVFFALLVGGDD